MQDSSLRTLILTMRTCWAFADRRDHKSSTHLLLTLTWVTC
ncbi:hypothetical protein [Vibrio phage 33Fb.4]|nr:hypothetical protein [Vibrio phage 31Fb.4]WAG58471.1 hypothetical protein [Vibrio phage 33Fb.4]